VQPVMAHLIEPVLTLEDIEEAERVLRRLKESG